MENEMSDYEYEKYGDFVSLQHLGAEFGLDYDTLVDRLEKGASLYMALNVPGNYDMEVKVYPKRRMHYVIRETKFQGSEKDLMKWLRK